VTDAASRLLAQRLGTELNVTVVIENRAGANGQIGAAAVANAAADGYTLLVASAETHSITSGGRRLSYDPLADFIPVGTFASNPFVLAGRASLAPRSLPDLVEHAKRAQRPLTFGSWGAGSTGHIAVEMFKAQAGIELLHVPFQGTSPAEAALNGEQIDLLVLPVGRAIAALSNPRVRLFSTLTANRSALLPDLPSLTEHGYQAVHAANWFGLVAPARTPDAVVARLAEALAAIVASPAFQQDLRTRGAEVLIVAQPDFHRFLEAERTRWSSAVERANVEYN
jgi:tripartite-type tricarboxylate transporter receptor subunit TctC